MCVYAYYMFWAFRQASQLLEFINVCSKLEAVIELNVFLLF